MGYKEIVKILLLNNADPLIEDNKGYNAITWGDIFKSPKFYSFFFKYWYFIKALACKEIEELFNSHDSKLIKKILNSFIEGN
jgi:hypothetical protein